MGVVRIFIRGASNLENSLMNFTHKREAFPQESHRSRGTTFLATPLVGGCLGAFVQQQQKPLVAVENLAHFGAPCRYPQIFTIIFHLSICVANNAHTSPSPNQGTTHLRQICSSGQDAIYLRAPPEANTHPDGYLCGLSGACR